MHRVLKLMVHVSFKVNLQEPRDGEADAMQSFLCPLLPAPQTSSGEAH